MSTTKDAEEGIPMEQAAAAPTSNKDSTATLMKKGPLFVLLALIFAMAAAAVAVGSVALSKVNGVDSDLNQLMLDKACDGEELQLVQAVIFPPIQPDPPRFMFVPPFDDPSWFGVVGNRLIYNKDLMYEIGTTNFTSAPSIGTLSGECVVIKPLTDPNDPPTFHCYMTYQLDNVDGEAFVGGLNDVGGTAKMPILGGWGSYWQSFSGYLESEFDPVTTQVTLKMYQTCSE